MKFDSWFVMCDSRFVYVVCVFYWLCGECVSASIRAGAFCEHSTFVSCCSQFRPGANPPCGPSAGASTCRRSCGEGAGTTATAATTAHGPRHSGFPGGIATTCTKTGGSGGGHQEGTAPAPCACPGCSRSACRPCRDSCAGASAPVGWPSRSSGGCSAEIPHAGHHGRNSQGPAPEGVPEGSDIGEATDSQLFSHTHAKLAAHPGDGGGHCPRVGVGYRSSGDSCQ